MFSEEKTTYISKMHRKTKNHLRIWCPQKTNLTTVKVRSLVAKQPLISFQVGRSLTKHPMYRTHGDTLWLYFYKYPICSFISVILERGNKLRNAMVVSALHCDTDSAPALKDTPLPLPKDNILLPSKFVFLKFGKEATTTFSIIF